MSTRRTRSSAARDTRGRALGALARPSLRIGLAVGLVAAAAACGAGHVPGDWNPPIAVRSAPAPELDSATARAAARTQRGAAPLFVAADCPPSWQRAPLDSSIEVRCGRVTVPQTRHSASAARRLAAVVLPVMIFNTDEGRDATPIVLLAGGPGESAVAVAQTVLLSTPLGRLAVRTRPIIAVDRRGYGAFHDRATPDLGFISNAAQVGDVGSFRPFDGGAADASAKLRREGIDPKFFGTSDAVDDLHDVLKSLGVQRAILLGLSYGTRDALQFMRRYPEMVEAAVLDGVAPPQADSLLNPRYVASARQRVALRVAASCLSDAVCGAENPDLAKVVEQLTRPDAPPLVVTAMGGLARPRTVAVPPRAMLATLGAAAGIEGVGAALPRLLRAMSRGDTLRDSLASVLVIAAADTAAIERRLVVAPLVYFAVLCADGPLGPPVRRGRAVCDAMGVPFAGAELTAPVYSDVPTLLLSSGNDSQTPPELATEVARTLTRSFHVHFRNVGHLAFMQPLSAVCVAAVATSFLADPTHGPARAPADACATIAPAPVAAALPATAEPKAAARPSASLPDSRP